MSFENKVAFVTGATGIAEAAAVALAREGYRVAVMARTESDLKQAVEEIEAQDKEGHYVQGDVSKPEDVQSAIGEIISRWGRLDMVFANAGINGTWAPIEELEVADWKKTLSINLDGTFHTVKFAVPHLKKQGGSIVITSSINGTRIFSNTGASAYAASKAAQVAFAKMMALELAPDGVRVNVICPGAISTDIEERTEREDLEEVRYPREFPEGKVPLTHGEPGSPEQVAELVVFLASDNASHITGTPVWIDGGQSLFL